MLASRGAFLHAFTTPLSFVKISISTTSHLPLMPSRISKNTAQQNARHRNTRQLHTSKTKAGAVLHNRASIHSVTGNKMASTESILKGKYPAKAHVKSVVEYMKKKNPDVGGVLYLEGQKTHMIEDNDGEAPFRYALMNHESKLC